MEQSKPPSLEEFIEAMNEDGSFQEFWESLENASEAFQRVLRKHCRHRWEAVVVRRTIQTSPVELRMKWLDIPNGLDGDYLLPVSEARDWSQPKLVDAINPEEEFYHCTICGQEYHGERL